jgi:cell division protein FtsB
MLGVFALVTAIGVQGVVTYMHSRAEADQQLAVVQSLAHANRALLRQQASLNNPATIVQDARALGMVRQGERAYVVTGLPGH